LVGSELWIAVKRRSVLVFGTQRVKQRDKVWMSATSVSDVRIFRHCKEIAF